MIKFENTAVMNFEGAIRGMRNPLNSWDKSDSKFNVESSPTKMWLGANDLDLARRLIKAGSDHRKFLRQIFVSVDINAPLYWWKEFDTYKVATVANSCSTMHKIHAKEIELSDFSFEDFSLEEVDHNVELSTRDLFINVVADCEYLRKKYLETKDRKYWRALIQLIPESYNQKRTVTLNYETLRNIYKSRKGHKLNEWSVGFMEWIESLPYADDLIMS